MEGYLNIFFRHQARTLLRGREGFTLFELLVVLAIIGLMSALAAPRLLGSIERMNLKTGAKKTAAGLRYARDRAASGSMTLRSVFDLDAGKMMIGPVSETSGQTPSKAGGTGNGTAGGHETYILPDGVRFEKGISHGGEATTSGRFQVAFYPSGASSGGEIIISGGRKVRYRVHVDVITGIVRLSEQWEE